MSIREELTRQAERTLRLGRVDEAIAQYQDLAYLAPVDWGVVKQLADLLERTGQREGAARQFSRWADHLFAEGFHSKAAALYKKVLKLEPADEHALWQLGDVCLELKLRADARLAFQRVAEIRQRRGDAAGAAAARERAAGVDGMPLVSAALPPRAAVPESVPQPSPEARARIEPAHSADAAPAPQPMLPTPAADPLAETSSERLAGLRPAAAMADARGDRRAEQTRRAALDADPVDAAARGRLVQAAMERGDLETAARLAPTLDASDDAAFAVLVDLAYQRGALADVDRLVADRVRDGSVPEALLGVIGAVSARRPGAARAAFVAAVNAWTTSGQPQHAVAALDQADGRGWLTTALYLRWVEILVDAGLPGLSRAQLALARAYRAEHRLVEARAVAEDVFVRDAGVEPSRTLLLDILEREGVDDPHRVLADLLHPPAVAPMGGEPRDGRDAVATSWPCDVGPAPLDLVASGVTAIDVADEPAASVAESHVLVPDANPISPMAAIRQADAAFDWSDLLGRDLDRGGSTVLASASADDASAVTDVVVDAVDDKAGSIETAAPIAAARVVEDTSSTGREQRGATRDDAACEPAASAAPNRSTFADAMPARIGDLRAQPLLAADAPLPPSFSVPRGWLSESPESGAADTPKRRPPEDDFFFDDDATPARWASPSVRAAGRLTPLAAPDAATPREPAPVQDSHQAPVPAAAAETASAEPGATSAADDIAPVAAVAEDMAPTPAVIEEADMPPPEDGSRDPEELPRDSGATLQVEEEVDLTDLLEELKQWNPVLPEPRSRQREAEAVDAASRDVELRDDAGETTGVHLDDAPVPSHQEQEQPQVPVAAADEPPQSTELDAVFAEMHRQNDDRVVAEQQLAAGRVFLAAGLSSEAARAFERASLEPRSRFQATLALAELHKSRGQVLEAVGWYEQAAMAPVPDAAVKRPVLYDLAESLEALGETDRALGVLLDLLSQVEDYRDARARLDRLLRVDAGG